MSMFVKTDSMIFLDQVKNVKLNRHKDGQTYGQHAKNDPKSSFKVQLWWAKLFYMTFVLLDLCFPFV